LIVLETFVGLSAVTVGVGTVAAAIPLPSGWLDSTPFTSYTVPGVLLTLVVGGSCLGAAWLLLRHPGDGAAIISVDCATILIGWMAAEVMLLGLVTWLEAFYGLVSVLITMLAFAYLSADEDERYLSAGPRNVVGV
jgi:hypothetical protein